MELLLEQFAAALPRRFSGGLRWEKDAGSVFSACKEMYFRAFSLNILRTILLLTITIHSRVTRQHDLLQLPAVKTEIGERYFCYQGCIAFKNFSIRRYIVLTLS